MKGAVFLDAVTGPGGGIPLEIAIISTGDTHVHNTVGTTNVAAILRVWTGGFVPVVATGGFVGSVCAAKQDYAQDNGRRDYCWSIHVPISHPKAPFSQPEQAKTQLEFGSPGVSTKQVTCGT